MAPRLFNIIFILLKFPWVLDDDRLNPVRTNRNRSQWRIGQFANPLQVVLGVDWQVFKLLNTSDIFIPTWQFFVDWFTTVQFLQACWLVVNLLAIKLVGSTDLNGL